MSKLTKVLLFAGIAGTGIWIGAGVGAFSTQDLTKPLFDTAAAARNFLGVGRDDIGLVNLPNGPRLRDVYAGVGTVADLPAANDKLRAELTAMLDVAERLAGIHAKISNSCADIRLWATVDVTAFEEKASGIASALTAIDAWYAATADLIRIQHPTSDRDARVARGEYVRIRVEMDELLKAMRTRLLSIPRLIETNCSAVAISPLKPEE